MVLPCTAPVNTSLLLLHSIFHFPVLTEFWRVFVVLWVMSYSPLYNPYHTDETLKTSRISVTISMTTFEWKKIYAKYTWPNDPHSRISLVRKKYNQGNYFQTTSYLRNILLKSCFTSYYNLNLFKSRSNRYIYFISSYTALFFTSYSYKYAIASIDNLLPWVSLGPCTSEQLNKISGLLQFLFDNMNWKS